MDVNLSQGGVGATFDGFDLPGSVQVHHNRPHIMHQHQPNSRQGSSLHSSAHGFPVTIGTLQNCDQTISKGERSKTSTSEEDEPSFNEDGHDGHNEASRGKKESLSPWQRVKWTDKMVRLMITAVSYIGEDIASDGGSGGGGIGRRKFAVLHKKGKWKCVSKVMAERGYHVSPQQCEDKFNDLNKRYKKLNDMLGRGTSCQVVENPSLLDVINYLNEKEKDDVRKILSSKHLFYEEMCSYHNGNRLHLPHDPALQCSMQLALRNRDDHDNDDIRKSHLDDHDEDEQDVETNERDYFKERCASRGESRGMSGRLGGSTKKSKQNLGQEDANTFGSSLNCQDYFKKGLYPHGQMVTSDGNQVSPENTRAAWLQNQYVDSRQVQLEEQKLQLQVEMMELEKQRFKWQQYSKKKDHELEKLSLENERMKLENERMALELKQKERGISFN